MTIRYAHDPATGDIVRTDSSRPDHVDTYRSRRTAKARLKRRARTATTETTKQSNV